MKTIGQAAQVAISQTSQPTKASPTGSWRPTCDESHPSVKSAADKCAQMAADMAAGAEPYWLTILGNPGVGKTMLAWQTFIEARNHNPGDKDSVWLTGSGVYEPSNRRPRCVWFDAPEFGDRMRGGEFDLPEYLRADYLVVIDDVGAARDSTNFLADGLYRLANARLRCWMIWTSNLSLPDISSRIDARVSSRLVRGKNRISTITAPDYALRQKCA